MNRNFIKKIILAVLGLTFFHCIGAPPQDWGQFSRFEKENAVIKEDSLNLTPKVVFLGNSITEGWALQDPDFFKDNNFLGRGISGQTTYQMLVRFREDVIKLYPQIVVINGGTNDVAENNHPYNPQRTLGNIKSMAELAQANGIEVILTSVLPSSGFFWRKTISNVPEKITALNKMIKDYAEEKGFIFVDYYPEMVSSGGALNPSYSKDGVHPNLEGYKVMEKIVLAAINSKREK